MAREMEPENGLNISISSVLGAVKRRRWVVLATFSVVTLATIAVLSRIPDRYSSDATLVVVQQQIPERYVTPTTTTSITETLQSIREEVLSRTPLLAIVDEFHLYGAERKRLGPEGLVEVIRKNISIVPIESQDPVHHDLSAFKLSFIAEDPRLAQEVTSRLTSLFIQENITTRERQATITTNFLKQRQEAARARLAQQEERLRDFKMKYLGELPEQQQGNLAILSGLEAQLQNTMAGVDRARQHRAYLESLLRAYRSLQPGVTTIAGISGPVRVDSPVQTIETELAHLKSDREEALNRYTPAHPDVIALNRKIAQTEALLKAAAAMKKEPETKSDAGEPPARAGSQTEQVDGATAQLRSEMEGNRIEIDNLTKDQKRLEESIADYQKRLNLTPVREQQLADILRDEDILKKDYTDLLSKEMQSQLAGSLEKEQAGQQFRLVDQPSLPTVPVSPKRIPICAGGTVAGVALGLVLAFLLDIRTGAVYSEEDIRQQLKLPLIVGVPILRTPAERRSHRWGTGLEWLAGSGVVMAVLAVVAYQMIIATPWLAGRILH